MQSAYRYELTDWTISRVLRHKATVIPENVFVITEEETLTYREAWIRSLQVANMLGSQGVEMGDHVAVMLPNGVPFCEAWLGIACLGAVHVAINSDYTGRFLVHVLNNCRARVMVIDASFIDRLVSVGAELEHLETVFVVGETSAVCSFKRRHFADWRMYPDNPPPTLSTYRDIGCVMYTSGTTGPSKGVLMPHAHLYLFGLGTIEHMGLDEDDVFYIVLPLFHANGLFMQLFATLIAGAKAVIRERFSASRWIDDIVRFGVTITNSLGVVAAFVLNQPPSRLDRTHRLRAMGLAPISKGLVDGLTDRFGIPCIYGMYGMTEANIPLYTTAGAPKPQSCGRVWSEFYALRIVDPESDEELPRGETGEIVVRPRQPYGFMAGYLNMPDKTVEAYRNFWFHTGDAAWMDDDGDVFFVDRIKDCIRRRGENISSFEVENALSAHPSIHETAVYAVPSEIEGAEEEVVAAVVPKSGSTIDLEELKVFALENLPAFAVPRYFRVMKELPKTPTGKIQKHVLRNEGVAPGVVDTLSNR
ncbi:MAG: ATP-dependent acyl-CoA ligase [Proteobacteria bacterium]|nr:MAG: ATP-dependent acyl-CoA ligase [Pseudomonadota bacterium]